MKNPANFSAVRSGLALAGSRFLMSLIRTVFMTHTIRCSVNEFCSAKCMSIVDVHAVCDPYVEPDIHAWSLELVNELSDVVSRNLSMTRNTSFAITEFSN